MSKTFISVKWEDAGDVDPLDVRSEGGDEATVHA